MFAYFFWCFAASFITWWWWSLGGDLLFACLHVSIAAFLTILMFCWKCYYMVMIVFRFACFFCSQDHHDVLLRRSVITCWRLRCLFESICCLHLPFAAFVIIMMFCWKCYYMVMKSWFNYDNIDCCFHVFMFLSNHHNDVLLEALLHGVGDDCFHADNCFIVCMLLL